jgi:hypothetical protein
VALLRELDARQACTDESGEPEVAWWCYRNEVEDVLGLDRGDLDSSAGDFDADPCASFYD